MSSEAKRQAVVAEIPRLRRYAIALMRDRTSADDLVQDCVVRALDRLHLWRDGSNMRTWLFTIMHNLHANEIRRRSRMRDNRQIDESLPERAEAANQEHAVELRQLAAALAELPAAQNEILLLVGLEGLSYAETAEVLGVPVGTVMSRVSRAREALRRMTDGDIVPNLRRVK
jgi:RNA polymerase sigma-70 factor (ECF subfamily)